MNLVTGQLNHKLQSSLVTFCEIGVILAQPGLHILPFSGVKQYSYGIAGSITDDRDLTCSHVGSKSLL